MVTCVRDKTGIHFASADVMFSDPYAMLTKDLTSAFVVGPTTADGVPCEHLAFTGPAVVHPMKLQEGRMLRQKQFCQRSWRSSLRLC
jgi:hypothetical protein